jgi:hypothetical protein
MSTTPVSTRKHDAGRIPGPYNNAGVVEVLGQWTLPNGKIIHGAVYGYAATPPAVNVALANTIFGALSSAWSTNLATYMHTGTSFNSVTLRDMTSSSNPIAVSTSAGVAGTSASTVAMPESMAIVMTENLAIRGRGAKGRLFLGGWAQSADVTTGAISSAVQTAINAMGTAWLSALNTNIGQACINQAPRQQYIGFTGTTHPARPAGHPSVTAYTCRDLVWDTQRRRVQL